MSSAFFGAGSSTLPLFFQSASPTSAGFTPIERIPLAPSFGSYFPINPSSKRLRSICKDRSRDSAGFENDASDAGVSDEEEHEYWVSSPSASPYQILGIDPASCSPARLKSAFRARRENTRLLLPPYPCMADPEQDHGFFYDNQGLVVVLRPPFFDINWEIDQSAEDYVDRIFFSLTIVLDEHWRPVQWRILHHPPISSFPINSSLSKTVKEFHPDVYKGASNSDEIILRVIVLSNLATNEFPLSSSDPFEEPESEAFDIFVNELLCIGKGCSYSCVKRAPYAFSFTLESGTARVVSQGHVDDYQVQLAVGQCPRKCIHYVTSSQRVILQDVLQRVLNNPFDLGEAAFLESLISKAILKNRRYQKPKRKPKSDAHSACPITAVINPTNSLSSEVSNGSMPGSNLEQMEASGSHNSVEFTQNFHEGYCNVSDLDDCRELTEAVTDVDSISSHCERGKSEDGDNDDLLGGVFVYSEGHEALSRGSIGVFTVLLCPAMR
ncbi:hypothetical protein MA16_Dca026530 [Dendrobium catenatum]|uniref:Uncharacterized protein n=1 Tax=Dendrobium catenatum TaxID=906689 RepID=A0A2I0W2N0_9ASPA|nr:hypothetical protein MA16_Dca026530 [Dendrobium catenatum]